MNVQKRVLGFPVLGCALMIPNSGHAQSLPSGPSGDESDKLLQQIFRNAIEETDPYQKGIHIEYLCATVEPAHAKKGAVDEFDCMACVKFMCEAPAYRGSPPERLTEVQRKAEFEACVAVAKVACDRP